MYRYGEAEAKALARVDGDQSALLAEAVRRCGGAVQVDLWLEESAWFQPLNLTCDIPVSKFAFKLHLVPLRCGDWPSPVPELLAATLPGRV